MDEAYTIDLKKPSKQSQEEIELGNLYAIHNEKDIEKVMYKKPLAQHMKNY